MGHKPAEISSGLAAATCPEAPGDEDAEGEQLERGTGNV
jgi:hypothetical protein